MVVITAVGRSEISERLRGKFYSSIFTMRQSADYEDYLDFSEEEVLDLFGPANELIREIEELLQ